jgi:hypothetical protein
MQLSEVTVHMPFSGKVAVFITSCYAVFQISDAVFHSPLINTLITALFIAILAFWFRMSAVVERSIWILVLIMALCLPILALIAVLILG